MELRQAMSVEGIEASAPFLASEGTFGVGSTTSWQGDALHTSPRRFILVRVTGEYAVTTSRGVTRRFGPGSVLLAEDQPGRATPPGQSMTGTRSVWRWRWKVPPDDYCGAWIAGYADWCR